MVIKNSFLELLQEKPVSRITVTEICRRSHINRTTFYKHYTDPLDLLEKLEEELLESIRSMIFPLVCSRYPNLDSTQQNLLYCYITQGFSGTVNCWLEGGMKEPAEEIAEFASRATSAVTRNFA